MKTHARVVIIGGGMLGCGLLYHLAEGGWTDCLLIEKGELTSGSTWHAAGQCPSFIADYNMAKVHHTGNTLYPELEALTGQYVGWHGCGGIRLARTEAEIDFFRKVEGVAKLIGFRMQIIGPDEIRRINPFITLSSDVLAGAWTLDDGHVDPAGCCNALARGARNMGAEIVRRNRVTGIRRTPSGEWEVESEQGTVRAEHVVNAAGCYARMVSRMVGTDAPLTNVKHHYVVTDPLPAFKERDEEMVVMRDPYPSAYYRQEQKAGLIGIYETENPEEAWPENGGEPLWESENELFSPELERIADPWLERVMERMPVFAEAGIKRIVNGAIPHTPDANPLIGPASGVRNFWQCNGSAIGIAQGAGLGKYLAQWIMHGAAEINMAGLDPRRFGDYADADYVRARSLEDYAHMYELHLPGEERSAGRGRRTSALHDTLGERGALYAAVAGWERPKYFSRDNQDEVPGFRHNNGFAAARDECLGVMETVGVGDFSAFAKYHVTGPDAAGFLDRVFANSMPRRVGGIALAHMLNPIGRIEGEATVTRLGDDRYYILSGLGSEVRDYDWLKAHAGADEKVVISNVTEDYGILVVAGPKARTLLSGISDADLSNDGFGWLTGREISIAGITVRALRVNYIGELGWELHVPMAQLKQLYTAVHEAGQAHGLIHFGAYAMNSMRMEKAYRGMGSELTNEITLIEADMERFAKTGAKDFIGREATLARKQAGVETRLVYCELADGDCEAVGGEAVMIGDRAIGVTTSGGRGHRVGKSLVFAYVEPDHADTGCEFDVLLFNQARRARVLSAAVYDPANARLKS